jgi:hypothetical protein
MLDFLSRNSHYLIILALCIFIVTRVIVVVLKEDNSRNDDEDDGGIYTLDEPVLDLPPGVTLPQDTKELV